MKKIAFIILVASILSACLSTPSQLTVTPEVTPTLPPTLIPTPTFHPQFIILQESIAASGTRFSLQPDGLIYDGDTPVPGVIVMPDGTVFLTVDGDKEIVIERDGYSFDDEEGFTVNGMEWDEGANNGLGGWVEEIEAAPTPEELWQQELTEWQLNAEDYAEKRDVDGNLAMVKKSTGEIVYWVDETGTGYWNLQVMRKMIVETEVKDKMCLPTRWVGTRGQSVLPKSDPDGFRKIFFKPLVDRAKSEMSKMGYPFGVLPTYDYLGGDNKCWATEFVESAPNTGDTVEKTAIAWFDPDRELRYELAFNAKVKKIKLEV